MSDQHRLNAAIRGLRAASRCGILGRKRRQKSYAIRVDLKPVTEHPFDLLQVLAHGRRAAARQGDIGLKTADRVGVADDQHLPVRFRPQEGCKVA